MGVSAYTYSLLDEGSVVKRRMVRLVIFLLTFIIFAGVIVPTYIAYSNSQNINNTYTSIANSNSQNINNTYTNLAITPPDTFGSSPGYFTDGDGIRRTTAEATFKIALCNIDSVKQTANICIDLIYPLDAAMTSFFEVPTTNASSFHFSEEVKTINVSRYTTEWSFPILVLGDNDQYPFDSYHGQFSFQFFANCTLIDGITTYIYAYGAPSGWDVTFNIISDDNGLFELEPIIRRSFVTKGFSLFIVILSWVLSLCQFFIAAQSLIRNREMIPQLLALPAALLFALPSLRNVQPDVPPIGIILDMAGFFWNMALVAISLSASCIIYILQYKVVKNQQYQ